MRSVAQKDGPGTTRFRPITTYILKIASRCNLNCKYCYMYNLADKSYRQQPPVMARDIVEATLTRMLEHSRRHNLRSIMIVFHGGEPMLAGEEFFRYFIEAAKARLEPDVTPHFYMQTNGTLLTTQWLDLLAELKVNVSISLDGPPEVNDANRVDHQGRGSYERVAEAIKLLVNYERVSSPTKILTVVNPDSDSLAVYRHFQSLGSAGIDFLLPDATYDNPPPGLEHDSEHTPYADWLIPVFDEWFDKGDGRFGIRLFENIIGLIFGAKYSNDNIGGRQGNNVVIETDGGIEPLDVLKACGPEFTKVGLNVVDDEIDKVYADPLFRMYLGSEKLCAKCESCSLVDICGGGYLPNRYSSSNGFDNPSIYCKDLIKLILHIQERTLNALPPEMRNKMQVRAQPQAVPSA
jgi:uncharacterized protein